MKKNLSIFILERQCIRMYKYQFSSVTQPCLNLCHPMDYSKPDFPVHHQLQQLAKTYVHQVGDARQPSHSLLPASPVFNLSQHQSLFQWVSSSHQVAKVLKLQFHHQSFQWIFRTDFLEDGLVGSPCSPGLFQHHRSKVSVLQHSAFFILQLSQPYMTNGKTIALTIWAFAGKVMSLLSNMLSKLVISFLPRSKNL